MATAYIHRELEKTILEAAEYFPVITVTGPRQSGKTTMLRQLFPHLNYYSLENPDVRDLAMRDPVRFLHQHDEGMILDEVHNAPALLSYIQGIVDDKPEKRFVLSGSSNFALLREVSQSLAGRSGVFELMPLSLSELTESGNEDVAPDVDTLLYRGLYPAVCAKKNLPKFLYPSYIKTYLDRDVRQIVNVKDIVQFNTFLRLCAGRIGSVVNAMELANETGVSTKTIQSWLSVLTTSYVIFLLPPYYENTRKRLTKSPKLYFCDTGLACSLLGIESTAQMARDKMRGHLFENFVVAEFLKRRLNSGKEPNICFYRDSNMNEVDLIVDNSTYIEAYEVKSAMTYHPDFERTLRKLPEWVNALVLRRAIVYTGDLETPSADIQVLNYRHLV